MPLCSVYYALLFYSNHILHMVCFVSSIKPSDRQLCVWDHSARCLYAILISLSFAMRTIEHALRAVNFNLDSILDFCC